MTRKAVRLALLCTFAVVAFPVQAYGQSLDRAADSLRLDPVYVDPGAERALSDEEAERLRETIRDSDAGPVYIAVLRDSARDEAGGDPAAAVREIARAVQEPGTYAAVIGSSLQAGATDGILPRGRASGLAAAALDSTGARGTAALLSDFVRRVEAARQERPGSSGGEDSDGGSGFPLVIVVLGLGAALLAYRRWQRRKRQRRALQEVKVFARDDLVALGDDIRALELDVEMPGGDPVATTDAKQHYGRAVELYQRADNAWERMRRPDEIEGVSSLLEEGRYEMTAAKARLEGRPDPEHRPPCFFDPRHGPSTADVEWAPPGGSPRAVPACAADAQRIADGHDPDVRQVMSNGAPTPYWNAGPAYLPWAGGFFGGGLLPGLFVGSALGGGLGLFDGSPAADAADGGDF